MAARLAEQDEPVVADSSLGSHDNILKVFVSAVVGDGEEYVVNVASSITVEQLKRMAVGHFLGPGHIQAMQQHQSKQPRADTTPVRNLPTQNLPTPLLSEFANTTHTTNLSATTGSPYRLQLHVANLAQPMRLTNIAGRPVNIVRTPQGTSNTIRFSTNVPTSVLLPQTNLGSTIASCETSNISSSTNKPTDHRSVPGSQAVRDYQLLYVKENRALADEASLAQEKVANNADLLLVPRRENANSCPISTTWKPRTGLAVTAAAIATATAHLAPLSTPTTPTISCPAATTDVPCPAPNAVTTTFCPTATATMCNTTASAATMDLCPAHRTLDEIESRVMLRRVLLTVAAAALRQLEDAVAAEVVFTAVLDKLIRRYTTSARLASLATIRDMGFTMAEASIALKLKSSVEAAADWLAEHNPHEFKPPEAQHQPLMAGQDPAPPLLLRFLEYRRSYFLVSETVYHRLVAEGFDRTRVFDALLQTENNETVAKRLLAREAKMAGGGEDLLHGKMPRSHPVVDGIMSSLILQGALHKPKLLYALLALCENPGNANLWMSDSDTNAPVRLIMKVHNAEKFNLHCCK